MKRNQAEFEAIRRIASETVTTGFANLGAVFGQNVVEITVRNDSDKTMVFSLDGGTTEHLELSAGSKETIDLGDKGLALPGGLQPQVKLLVAGAATAGTNVTISALVAKSQSFV